MKDAASAEAAAAAAGREKRLVHGYGVKAGMARLHFMLDCCHPGSIPDPHLMAALLDLVRKHILSHFLYGGLLLLVITMSVIAKYCLV